MKERYLDIPPGVSSTLPRRFWSKVDKTEGCWLWTGETNGTYGRIRLGSLALGRMFVHRLSYIWTYGAIPEGYQIDHICRTPLCVNPAHLRAVTYIENQLASPDTFASKWHAHPAGPDCITCGGIIRLKPSGARYCVQCSARYLRRWRQGKRE
jgi:HNH endonuclease